MRVATIFTLLFLFFSTNPSFGQSISTQDSITQFYAELFNKLEEQYLNRSIINWREVEKELLSSALMEENFEDALNSTSNLFDTIACNHCILFTEEAVYGSSLNKPLSQDDFSQAFLLEYEKNPSFEVKLISDKVGYILIPGMLLIDLTQDSLNAVTQKLYDQVVALAQQTTLDGWIVDLRFNIGGNVYPMLVALHPLLGNNIVYNTIGYDGSPVIPHQLENGGFYSGEKLETKVSVNIEPDINTPVAIITSKMTASAGEDIAIAFKNRGNVIFIGEKSYGFLTANDMVELPYNTQIALTTSYITDLNGKYRAFITPDVEVVKQDNFEDLTKDKNVIEAMIFFEKTAK